ncbi:MAG: imidazole glycerol phosphate synthase subunit HisH [Alphaproteobacteria bacterium]|nr:MAG: imidazole glycerol phosphate synthase subunit HisH [Alphaproteobacteria bacterium]
MIDVNHIAIIDYGAGNLHSVHAALQRVAQPEDRIMVTHDPRDIAHATHVILPGVGSFGDCITALTQCTGMIDAIEHHARFLKKPFLGICVGMQMLLERGHEHGVHAGLGWIEGEVVMLDRSDPSMRIPHMGWNELKVHRPHPLLDEIVTGDHVYFVHSYYARLTHNESLIASTYYGAPIPAMIGYENIIGVQFHPEKSHKIGAKILENFLKMR